MPWLWIEGAGWVVAPTNANTQAAVEAAHATEPSSHTQPAVHSLALHRRSAQHNTAQHCTDHSVHGIAHSVRSAAQRAPA